MSRFDDFLAAVLSGAADLATTELGGLEQNARTDAQAFVQTAKADLLQWTTDLAQGRMTPDQFEDLVKGEADLAKLNALTQAGVGLARLQAFRDGLIQLVITSARTILLP